MQALPKKIRPASDQPFSMFFGLTVSRHVVPTDARRAVLTREKLVTIAHGYNVSPHVVDLTSFVSDGPKKFEARPGFDFEQKMAIWSNNLRSAFSSKFAAREFRLVPDREVITGGIEAPIAPKPRIAPPTNVAAFRAAMPLVQTETYVPAFRPQVVAQPRPVAPQPRRAPIARRTGMTRLMRVSPNEPRITVAPILPRASWARQLATFATLAVLVTLPVYVLATYSGLLHDAGTVAAQAQDAVASLVSAGQQTAGLDADAKSSFDRAAATFAETRSRLRGVDVAIAALASGKSGKLKDGEALLAGGEAISKAGSAISDAFDALDKTTDQPLPARVQALTSAMGLALPHLDDAVSKLDGVSASSLPGNYRAPFTLALADLHTARDNVRRFTEAAPAVMQMLGASGKRRYLVLFQNERELRPTGGFIGSFALMDVEDGKIVHMEIPPGGPYDMRAGLNERLLAPSQLRLVNTRWEFQDANWFADFPASANNLAQFYQKSGGPTVDGVVAVTSNVMERLLQVVGPVDLPEYGKTITSDNFYDETQKAVEVEYDKTTNKPKQFIADLAPKVLKKLFEGGKGKLPDLMAAASDALTSKDIQLWFTNADQQAAASSFGWTGELKPATNADFLSVVDTNIAGGKTDGAVSEDVRLESVSDDKGAIVDTLTITRTNHGTPGDAQTGIKNIDYVRVLVPTGSELLTADGFEKPADSYFQKPDDTLQASAMLSAVEGRMRQGTNGTDVSDESGLTAFGNWIQVAPGESRTVTLSYRLPFRLADLASTPTSTWDKAKDAIGAYVPLADWKLVVRRQAGTRDRTFSTLARLPNGWTVKSQVPDALTVNGEGIAWHGPLDRDLYLGAVLADQK